MNQINQTPPRKILSIPNDPSPYVIVEPKNPKSDWCVLWIGGWTSAIDKHYGGLVRMADMSGVSFAMMEFAGFGQHPIALGDSTKAQQIVEARYFYDFLREEYKKIIVIGGSFGAYVAAQLSDKNPAAIVLRVPAIHDDQHEYIPYRRLKEDGNDDDKDYARLYAERWNENAPHVFDKTLKPLGEYEGMVYVIRHENDEEVPRWIPDLYFQTAKRGNYMLVPGAGHAPMTTNAAAPQKYYDYIEKMVTDIVGLEIMAKEKEL